MTRADATRADIIAESLELAAEICGDPRDAIYARVFEARPELQELFLMDTDGGVRGAMLQQSLECLMDFAGPRSFAPGILASELQRHEGYGVPPDVFESFFDAIRETFRDALGPRWLPDVDAAWTHLLREIKSELAIKTAA